MRLADADVLPYRFTNLADTVGDYLKEVQELLKQKQEQVKERNRELEDGVYRAINDPRRPRLRRSRRRCRRTSTSRRCRMLPTH